MDIKRTLQMTSMILIVAALVVGLSACTRSKSSEPAKVPAGDSAFTMPTAGATNQNMGIFDQLNTQTPVAPLQVVNPTPAVATSLPILAATATPVAAVAAQPQPVKLEPTKGPLPATYTLQKGEFPFCIARRFDVDQYELLSINGLNSSSSIQPGAVLKIPQTGKHFVSERSLKSHPAQYTVKSGDTIYTIACAYGDVSPDMIVLANPKLSSPYTLSSGDVLSIP